MYFEWNEEKNILLKEARNISFEDIVIAIKNDKILDFIESPTHENQSCFVIDLNGYYLQPYVYKVIKWLDKRVDGIISGKLKISLDKNGYIIEDPENGGTGLS